SVCEAGRSGGSLLVIANSSNGTTAVAAISPSSKLTLGLLPTAVLFSPTCAISATSPDWQSTMFPFTSQAGYAAYAPAVQSALTVESRNRIGPPPDGGPISNWVTPGEVLIACTALVPPTIAARGLQMYPLSGEAIGENRNHPTKPSET